MINVPSMASRAGMLIGVLLVAIAITIGIGSTAFAQAARSPTAGQTLYLPLVIGGQDRPDPLHIAERDALFAWMQKERAAAHPACAANQIQQHASLMAAAQEWAMLIDSIEPTFLGRRPRENPRSCSIMESRRITLPLRPRSLLGTVFDHGMARH